MQRPPSRFIELAQRRGVRDVRVANACGKLSFDDGEFDTAVLFGNNLGLCGTLAKFKRMLRELHRITSSRGRILATTRMPSTTISRHRAYISRNIAHGRAPGQVRLRLTFNGRQGAWLALLLFTPTDLIDLAAKEGWQLSHVFTEVDLEDAYSVVMEKT